MNLTSLFDRYIDIIINTDDSYRIIDGFFESVSVNRIGIDKTMNIEVLTFDLNRKFWMLRTFLDFFEYVSELSTMWENEQYLLMFGGVVDKSIVDTEAEVEVMSIYTIKRNN
jgi:hypothetical protein